MRAIVRDGTDFWMHAYTPAPGDIVFDIGAGIGEDTLAFSQRVHPGGKVVAIEAHPRTLRCLQKTVLDSRLTNVLALGCALYSADREITISDVSRHLDNTVVNRDGSGLRVTARSIDSLVKELRLPKIDLLKMNIEGAEVAALEGMQDSAAQVHNVVISCHDFVADKGGPAAMRTKSRVMELLLQKGFRILPFRSTSPLSYCRDYVYATRRAVELSESS
jgi:FkbM family methyltransferase